MIAERIWERKRTALTRELEDLAERSPVFEVAVVEHRPDELRTVVAFEVPTLVVPVDDRVRLAGPVVLGMRYLRRFCTAPPHPWEIVSILHPLDVHHPNVSGSEQGQALCLGSPPAALGMEAIVHLAYAAITLSSANTIDWEGLNPTASEFVRRHADAFPIVETGLLESPPPEFHRPFAPIAAAIAAELREERNGDPR